MRLTCGNCRFYEPEAINSPKGNCCLNPPQLIMGQQQSQLAGRANVMSYGMSPPTAAVRPACKEHLPSDAFLMEEQERAEAAKMDMRQQLMQWPRPGRVEVIE